MLKKKEEKNTNFINNTIFLKIDNFFYNITKYLLKMKIIVGDIVKQAQDFDVIVHGYPLIGAGLAGGDWAIISKIIDEELKDENHTLVKYSKKN